jgi:hypothetical protein
MLVDSRSGPPVGATGRLSVMTLNGPSERD